MAEQKPLNRGAKILKKKLEKPRVANANNRARAKAPKASFGTFDKVKKLPKPVERPGLPAKQGTRAVKPFKAPGREVVPYKAPGREVVPYKAGPRGMVPYKGAAGAAVRGVVGRALWATGPIGALVGMTTPAGDEYDDKPSGPLMRGNSQTVDRSGKGDRESGPVPIPKARPSRPSAPKPVSRPKAAVKSTPKKTFKKPELPFFKGNWTGAAPTAMQRRAGMRKK